MTARLESTGAEASGAGSAGIRVSSAWTGADWARTTLKGVEEPAIGKGSGADLAPSIIWTSSSSP